MWWLATVSTCAAAFRYWEWPDDNRQNMPVSIMEFAAFCTERGNGEDRFRGLDSNRGLACSAAFSHLWRVNVGPVWLQGCKSGWNSCVFSTGSGRPWQHIRGKRQKILKLEKDPTKNMFLIRKVKKNKKRSKTLLIRKLLHSGHSDWTGLFFVTYKNVTDI